MTCGENVIPDVSRDGVLAGSVLLFNPTSEGNLGRHVYYTTWGNCVIRAVENRVGVVRVGNNGISGFIGPDGLGYGEVRGPGGELWLVRGTSTARVKVDTRASTFFTRHGRLIGTLFPVATVLLMIGVLVRARRNLLRQPGGP
jgi:apolipoprotein N-acyltransferase